MRKKKKKKTSRAEKLYRGTAADYIRITVITFTLLFVIIMNINSLYFFRYLIAAS